nr:FUSC family protein [Brevibacterium daeguense]
MAYSFCFYVLGHAYPFLAAVAAAVGTGVTADRRVRRAMEIGLGATAGVLVGEAMVATFGTGLIQLAVTMFIGLVIGTMINSGAIFITQIGIQSIYVVTVPPLSPSAEPLDRTTDALVGAVTAILMALVVPDDARKGPRDKASSLLQEISEALVESADALARADPEAARRALNRARDSQGIVDSWRSSLRISQEATRINARSRRYAAEVTRLSKAVEFADRAMRMVRVVARRIVAMTELGTPRPDSAELVEQFGDGANRLRIALQRGTSRVPAEEFLSEATARLDPSGDRVTDMQDRTLVLLLRPLAVDLLQAAGVTEDAAHERLPVLKGDTTEGPPVE